MSLVEQCVQGKGFLQINDWTRVKEEGKLKLWMSWNPSEEEISVDEAETGGTDCGRGGWCAPSVGREAGETFHFMSTDPAQWNASYVMHCTDVRLHLGSITHDQFKSRVSLDPHYFFLTHPELLRKCNFVKFKLNNSEIVAQLWGARKNNLNINYEKLSRALRHYYDRDMICKVHGKWFVYKFVCDLNQLLVYSTMPTS